MFRLIAFTAPHFIAGEEDKIVSLLDRGFWRVHLRKPASKEEELAELIRKIPLQYRKSLSLHDHFSLAERFQTGGVNLNSRNPSPPEGFDGMISRSCHSFGEVARYKEVSDYLFLSPVFDSISKKGYCSSFRMDDIRRAGRDGIIDSKVFALGGIDDERLGIVESLGFGGAALLGSLCW